MRPRSVIAILLIALVVAACSGSSDTAAITTTRLATASTSSTTTTSTSVAESADQAAVRTVAEGWSKAAFRIGMHPDPNDPAIERYLTGELLTGWRAEWTRRMREGLVTRDAVPSRSFYRIDRISIDGSMAVLNECVLDDGILYRKVDGVVIDDKTATLELRTVAVKTKGVWKLSAREAKTLTGVAGCAREG